jgi:hypothetical protein
MTLPAPYFQNDAVTIYLGDCREIVPHLPPVDLVLTDPPYGISADNDLRRFGVPSNRTWDPIVGDDVPFDPTPWLTYRCVLFGANYYAPRLPIGGWLIWNKNDCSETHMLLNDAEMAWTNCSTAVRVFNWFWRGVYRKGEHGTAFHPAQKPVELMKAAIVLFGGDLILDPFMGSGTTLRAAKDLGRKAIGIEIEERYCEVAAKRMAQGVLL